MLTHKRVAKVTIDRLGTSECAARIGVEVVVTIEGIEHVGRTVFEGKTDSPYTRTVDLTVVS
jgi:hypothetical protein